MGEGIRGQDYRGDSGEGDRERDEFVICCYGRLSMIFIVKTHAKLSALSGQFLRRDGLVIQKIGDAYVQRKPGLGSPLIGDIFAVVLPEDCAVWLHGILFIAFRIADIRKRRDIFNYIGIRINLQAGLYSDLTCTAGGVRLDVDAFFFIFRHRGGIFLFGAAFCGSFRSSCCCGSGIHGFSCIACASAQGQRSGQEEGGSPTGLMKSFFHNH